MRTKKELRTELLKRFKAIDTHGMPVRDVLVQVIETAFDMCAEVLEEVQAPHATQMREVLKDYEQWEADLISNNDVWYDEYQEPRESPIIPRKLWNRLLEIQAKRNKVLSSSR